MKDLKLDVWIRGKWRKYSYDFINHADTMMLVLK